MANATPSQLLLPALLAMDVYHRDVIGGLKTQRIGDKELKELGKELGTATISGSHDGR